MARNRVSFRWLDLESASEAEDMLKHLDVRSVTCRSSSSRRVAAAQPERPRAAQRLGLAATNHDEPAEVCDLLVVGGGPAGLRPRSTGRRRG